MTLSLDGSAADNGSPDELPTARLARAVVYLRVSTKEQAERGGGAEGFSIPAQREACQRKATSLDAEVIEEFIDAGESAKTAHRPELQRLLRFLKDNPVQYVIVHKVDRLARNRVDDVEINVAIRKSGAALVSCTENIDETPSGALMHGIMSSIAEFYSRNLANEVIKGSVQKAKGGGTIGKAPTGYLNIRKWENGTEVRTVELDPERSPLMRWAFEEYASGEWTIRRLLDALTEKGLASVASKQKPSKPLVVSNLHRLLRHPYYKGIVRYRGVEYPGKHEPLVSTELWDRVQDVLDAQNFAGEKTRDHPHYLKGSVFCGQCGSRLVVSKHHGRRGKLYEYFVCIGRNQKRTNCTQRAMLIDLVELKVEQYYEMVRPTRELLDQIHVVLKQELQQHREHAERERAIQERRIRKLEDERMKLLDGYYAGAIPIDLMKSEQQRISSMMTAATGRLDMLNAEFEKVEANLDQAIQLAGNWHEAYMRATDTERRLLNQAIFEKLYVCSDGDIAHEFAEPFDVLLGQTIVRTVVEQINHEVLTPREKQALDRAWAELSAVWEAEERSWLIREINQGRVDKGTEIRRNPKDLAVVGVSNMDLMVGAEGLEPPTPAL